MTYPTAYFADELATIEIQTQDSWWDWPAAHWVRFSVQRRVVSRRFEGRFLSRASSRKRLRYSSSGTPICPCGRCQRLWPRPGYLHGGRHGPSS
jgi:hypothetical protein